MSPAHGIDFSIDYYGVLEVSPDASEDEIDRSFRRLVLAFHPDKNPERRDWSEQRSRELIAAHDILGDVEKRRLFDRFRERQRARLNAEPAAAPEEPFFFRRRGPGARALLILHHLLRRNPSEAVTLLREEESRHGFGYLEEFLDRTDYLDCLFLLGEHFLAQKDYLGALDRLKRFQREDRRSRQPRQYSEEAERLLKDLLLRRLPRVLEPESALDHLATAADLGWGRTDEVLRLRRMIELEISIDRLEDARATLADLVELDPHAKCIDQLEGELAARCAVDPGLAAGS